MAITDFLPTYQQDCTLNGKCNRCGNDSIRLYPLNDKYYCLFCHNQLTSVYIHSTAEVDGAPLIGNSTKIWHFCHIMKTAQIGKNCILGQNVFVGENVKIGDNCKIQNNVSLYEEVELEDDVFVGPSAVFTNVINPRAFINRKKEFKKTLVKRGASIGANATIICGVTIGEYAMIAAGATLTKDAIPYKLYMGSPARVKGLVDREGNIHGIDCRFVQLYHPLKKHYTLVDRTLGKVIPHHKKEKPFKRIPVLLDVK